MTLLRPLSFLVLLVFATSLAAADPAPWLGAKLRVLDKDELKKFEVESGLYVDEVTKESPAELAGLEKGDIVLSAGEKTLSTIEGMEEVLAKKRPGDALNLGVRRDNGKVEPLIVKLGTRVRVKGEYDDDKRVIELREKIQQKKNETQDLEAELDQRLEDLRSGKAKPETREKPTPETPVKPDEQPVKPVTPDPTKVKVKLRAKLASLEAADAKAKGLDGGVVINSVETGGAAEKAGLKAGDIIYEAGAEKVTGTGDFRTALSKVNPGDSLDLKVLRGNDKLTIKVTFEAA